MTNKISSILAVCILTVATIQAQINKQVKQMAYADSLRLVEIFKDIHQNPELGFREIRSSLFELPFLFKSEKINGKATFL